MDLSGSLKRLKLPLRYSPYCMSIGLETALTFLYIILAQSLTSKAATLYDNLKNISAVVLLQFKFYPGCQSWKIDLKCGTSGSLVVRPALENFQCTLENLQ